MLDKLLLIAARGPGEIERTIEEYTYELNQVDTRLHECTHSQAYIMVCMCMTALPSWDWLLLESLYTTTAHVLLADTILRRSL
jgi:hypothetical protein